MLFRFIKVIVKMQSISALLELAVTQWQNANQSIIYEINEQNKMKSFNPSDEKLMLLQPLHINFT